MNHTSNIYIFGIDPGTNTGVSVFELDVDLNVISVETHTLNLNLYADPDSNQLTKDADRYLALGDLISELADKFKPVAAAIESSFIHERFKSSGMKVAAYISVVIYALKKFDKNLVICKLSPKQVKKFMGDATADKDEMRNLLTEKISLLLGEDVAKLINIDNLTEHSIDALAIGNNLIEVLRKAPYLVK